MKTAYLFLCIGLTFGGAALNAQTDSSQSPADEKAITEIRQAAAAYRNAFNSHDAAGVAAHFTVDGDYIDDAGERTVGRDAIRKQHESFFASNPKASLHLAIDDIRLLGSTAIEDGRAVIGPSPEGAPVFSKYTAIHVKQNGKWLTASVRDSRIETPVDEHQTRDFEWLVGGWHVERDGIKLDVKFRWLTGNRFLVRTFNVHTNGDLTQSGMQVIGWNPIANGITSWLFDSTGGHAVGNWSPSESGWTATAIGVTRDGAITNATNSFRRVDQNTLGWKSGNRSIDGTSIPDIEEVLLTRKKE